MRRALLTWFRTHARPLPWRGARDPYPIWVSEVMLQQTQISTVIPYYQRFLEHFPALPDLAKAPLERVLELWSGLGYYRRARHLHQAAQMVIEKLGEKFPEDYVGLRALPGIGDYTARALLSMAFNQPFAVLDGNVARVVARLLALRGHLHQSQFRGTVETELAKLLSRRKPGNFNQAVMELGQTLCLPRGPRCSACPLKPWCRAFRSSHPEAFPLPRPRRAGESRDLAAALLRRGARVALVRGLEEGLLDDLWNFPSALGGSPAEARERLREKLYRLTGSPISLGEPAAEFLHGITYRAIRARIYPVEGPFETKRGSVRWLPLPRLPGAAISQLARKIALKIQEPGLGMRGHTRRRASARRPVSPESLIPGLESPAVHRLHGFSALQ